jgi:RNase P subunit RPR2
MSMRGPASRGSASRGPAKSVVPVKAAKKVQNGPLVRLPSKKLFCTKCLKLVRGKIQNSGINTQISCPKCATQLRVWTITSWKTSKDGAD